MSFVSVRPFSEPAVRRALTAVWSPERCVAALLILAAAIWHISYLINGCPLELAADEAHYWDWSRRLDWSYYSKGPLVAWMLRLSRELVGELSIRLCGSELLAVRLPAALCGAGLLVSVYLLAERTLRCERRALAVVAVALTLPMIAAGATIMTIDAPFTCAWGWALVFGHSAIFRQSRWAWPAAGLAVGLGILAKYTMVLWLPCMGLFLLARPEYRGLLRRRGFWIAGVIAAACCLPILIWNVKNGWVTLRHVGWQAGAQARGMRWLGPLQFVTEQAGLLLFYWFGCWVAAMLRDAPGRVKDPHRAYLWWMSAPIFMLFLVFSLRTPGQINWAAPAYLSGMILAVDWLAWQWQSSDWRWARRLRVGLALAIAAGIGMTAILHHPTILRPVLVAMSGEPTLEHPQPLRRFDPTARLRGWQCLSAAVDEIRARLDAVGEAPVLATAFWNLNGEIAFYGQGHPEVYCLGPAVGERLSQYDLWRPNPLWDPEKFLGRTFIFVGDLAPEYVAAFDSCETTVRISYQEGGHELVFWNITVCRGYRGFGPIERWGKSLHF